MLAQKQTKTIQEKFEAFDKAHPEVYQKFKEYALRLRKHRQHYSARVILSGFSFNTDLDGRGAGEKYKMNNNYSSRFARKLLAEMPEVFAGFFEQRQLKAE